MQFSEGIISNNSVKLFEFGPVVQEEMSFKAISYLALWRPLLQGSGTICANLEEGIMQEEQFCEISLNLGQWFRRRCHLKIFLSGALGALVFVGEEHFMHFW